MTACVIRITIHRLENEIIPELIRSLVATKRRYRQNTSLANYLEVEQSYIRIAATILEKQSLKIHMEILSRV